MTPTRKAAGLAALGIAFEVVVVGLLLGVRSVPGALVVTTFAGALTFCAVYVRRHWRTPVGYNLMALAVVMIIETSLAILGVVFGTNWPWRDQIRAAAWALVAYVLWWRVGLLFTLGLGAPAPVQVPVADGLCPCCFQRLPDNDDDDLISRGV